MIAMTTAEIAEVVGGVAHGDATVTGPAFFDSRAVEPGGLLASLRREVAALDRGLAVHDVATMKKRLADALASRRFNTLLLGAFATSALLLAAVVAGGRQPHRQHGRRLRLHRLRPRLRHRLRLRRPTRRRTP